MPFSSLADTLLQKMGVNGRIRFEYAIRADGKIFESEKKKLRIQKYPDTCGPGPSKERFHMHLAGT